MSAEWALEVFDKAPFITVSMTGADGNPYGLPLSLVRTDEKTFWFHCATEGKKLDILKANPRVFLSAVTKCRPLRGPKDGSFTLEFQSATAIGMAEIVEDENEKKEALRAICQRFLPQQMEGFEEAVSRSLHRTAVVRITLTEPYEFLELPHVLAYVDNLEVRIVREPCLDLKAVRAGRHYIYFGHKYSPLIYSNLPNFISSPFASYCLRLPTGGSVRVILTTAVL